MLGLLKELTPERQADLLWLWTVAGTILFGREALSSAIKEQETIQELLKPRIPEQSPQSRVDPEVWQRVHELFNHGWAPKRIRDQLKLEFGKQALAYAHIAQLKGQWKRSLKKKRNDND